VFEDGGIESKKGKMEAAGPTAHRDEEVAPTTLTVVFNWLNELAARVPTD